ncbi:MAG: diguanylate cyclase [Candidatus Korobacteraceae bacterium]
MHLSQNNPEAFVVKAFSELSADTIQRRWRDVNALLRLSMLAGLPMDIHATLELLCDTASDIARHEKALAYFWDDDQQRIRLWVSRNDESHRTQKPGSMDVQAQDNVLNCWASRYSRPLLVRQGQHPQCNALLTSLNAGCAVALPLVVNNQPLGCLQFFSTDPGRFTEQDAQLLWIMALIAETPLARAHANQGLLTLAFTDYLTGLKTRGYFEQQLDLEISRFERKHSPFALLMADIDFFKPLNDRYGHHVGDQVLRDVAALLMKDMRDIDTVARYGGEEFVIILPETSGQEAMRVAHRLLRRVGNARFFAGSPAAVEHLTISLGVAVFDADANSKAEIIERADAALYEAKSRGRNQVVMYSTMQRVGDEIHDPTSDPSKSTLEKPRTTGKARDAGDELEAQQEQDIRRREAS